MKITIYFAQKSFGNKHKSKAQQGWYRYDTRFGIPAYNLDGALQQYNIYSARMLVRCDENGKLYLYDLVRTKKETRYPSWNAKVKWSETRFFL